VAGSERVSDYPLLDWLWANQGEEAWMVCRNGHLWQAQLPYVTDYTEDRRSVFFQRRQKERLQRVRVCSLCQVLRQAGNHKLRGVTKVHPDWQRVITGAQLLANGTVEHHHPEQVAQAFSEDEVKAWRAAQALVALLGDRRGRC
jgi:hypothetical protein